MSSKPAAVLFALRFVSQGTSAVRQVQGQMRRLRAQASLASRALRFQKVGEAWRGLKSGMRAVADQSGMLGRAIRGALAPLAVLTSGAGAAGLYNLIHSVAVLGNDLAKLGARSGFTVEQLQELQYAAKRVGAEDAFEDAIKDFTKNIGEAANGTGEAIQVLDALGVRVTNSVTNKVRPGTDILNDFADALSKVPDEQTRFAIANKVMGESGGRLVLALKDGRKGLTEYAEEARRFGLITANQARQSEGFMDRLTDLWQALRGISAVIAARLIPIMSPLIAQFTSWAAQNREVIATRIGEFIRDVGRAFAELDWAKIAAGFQSVIGAVVAVKDFFGSWGKTIMWVVVLLHADLIAALVRAAWATGRLAAALAVTAARMALLGAAAVAKTVYDFFLAMKYGVGIMRALSIAMVANPIGVLVMALAAAAGLIYAYWEPIKAFFAKFDFLSPIKKQVASLARLLPDWVTAKLGLKVQGAEVAGASGGPVQTVSASQALGRGAGTHPSIAMARAPAAGAAKSEVTVKITADNLPDGMRLQADPPRGDAPTQVHTQRVGRGRAGRVAYGG